MADRRAYFRRHYWEHRQERLAYAKAYYAAHRPEIRDRQRQYFQAHRRPRRSQAKFRVGDRVRFNGRAPDYILDGMRRRVRTVVGVVRDEKGNCYYELGGKGRARHSYMFRSYMLIPAGKGQKRSYGGRKSRYRFLLTS